MRDKSDKSDKSVRYRGTRPIYGHACQMRIRPISSRFDLKEVEKIGFVTISAAAGSDESIGKTPFSSQVRCCEPGAPVLFLRRVEGSL
jgi:hypothetical protein